MSEPHIRGHRSKGLALFSRRPAPRGRRRPRRARKRSVIRGRPRAAVALAPVLASRRSTRLLRRTRPGAPVVALPPRLFTARPRTKAVAAPRSTTARTQAPLRLTPQPLPTATLSPPARPHRARVRRASPAHQAVARARLWWVVAEQLPADRAGAAHLFASRCRSGCTTCKTGSMLLQKSIYEWSTGRPTRAILGELDQSDHHVSSVTTPPRASRR